MKTKIRTCALLLSLALAPATWAAGEPASACPKTKTAEQVLSEPLCGNDAACAARKAAELQEAAAAHKCEMARLAAQALSPVPVPLPVTTTP